MNGKNTRGGGGDERNEQTGWGDGDGDEDGRKEHTGEEDDRDERTNEQGGGTIERTNEPGRRATGNRGEGSSETDHRSRSDRGNGVVCERSWSGRLRPIVFEPGDQTKTHM